MSYTTRALSVTGQIRGIQTENLIDTMNFIFPDELEGFDISVYFSKEDGTELGTVSLVTGYDPFIDDDINYPIPSGLTAYGKIKYEIVANNPATGRIWKSAIGYFYFGECLGNEGDTPIVNFEPYPNWLEAIEGAEQATISANAAATTANDAMVNHLSATNPHSQYAILVSAPATPSSPGNVKEIAYDATHFYVCIGSNSWVRANLTTW